MIVLMHIVLLLISAFVVGVIVDYIGLYVGKLLKNRELRNSRTVKLNCRRPYVKDNQSRSI